MTGKIFKNKNFLRLWASQATSLLTINILNFLVIVLIFEKTGSTIASSFIWVAYAIPAIITGPFAAAAVDMYDRRRILVWSNLAQTIIVFAYAFLFERYIFLSYGVIALYSLINQLYVPAETAFLTKVVKKDELVEANSIFFVSQQAATIVAFGLAGLLHELIGFQATVLLASAWLLVAYIATLWLPQDDRKIEFKAQNIEDKLISFILKMKEGFTFIRGNKQILYPFLFLVWLQISMSVLVVNLPAIAIEIVKTRPALSGILVVLPAGAGAILGTVLVSRLAKKMRSRKIVHGGLVGLSVGFLAVSLLVPLLPFWIGRAALVSSFFLAGSAFVSILVPTMTYMQMKTPREFAGRVFGNFWFVTTAATVFPVIFSATITEILGARLMLVILGITALVAYFASKKVSLHK